MLVQTQYQGSEVLLPQVDFVVSPIEYDERLPDMSQHDMESVRRITLGKPTEELAIFLDREIEQVTRSFGGGVVEVWMCLSSEDALTHQPTFEIWADKAARDHNRAA
jgi:hypothetical protein